MNRSDLDFVIEGYARAILSPRMLPDVPLTVLAVERLQVGDIAPGTLRKIRADVTSFVRKSGGAAESVIAGWIEDLSGLNDSYATGLLIRKLGMMGSRFLHTRQGTLLTPTWQWFKTPDWGTPEMAARLHEAASSFPAVEFHFDQKDGKVRQR